MQIGNQIRRAAPPPSPVESERLGCWLSPSFRSKVNSCVQDETKTRANWLRRFKEASSFGPLCLYKLVDLCAPCTAWSDEMR